MRKPSNTLLEAMDQMEQIPGIAGVWSEVRCQTRHTKPMRTVCWRKMRHSAAKVLRCLTGVVQYK